MRWVPSSMSAPWESKKRISTESGSPAARLTVIPPCARSVRTWKRVSGAVASSRSITLMPARFKPAMIARFNARAVRLVSRLVVTTEPFGSDVPYASARRTATSEVMSTLASPRTPRRPNSVRARASPTRSTR